MPRGFNEQERQEIKQKLLEQGRNFFSKYGLKKTRISELAEAVGIAPGSFYTFFNSKEELYFDILEMEEEKIKHSFINMELLSDSDPKAALRERLFRTLEVIDTNSLIRQMYFDGDRDRLLRKVPKERLSAHFQKDSFDLRIFTNQWKKSGVFRDIDDDVLAGLFRSIFLLSTHKEEIGGGVYQQTMELLVELVTDGLILEEE
ncbi:TetR/AcrR family transcriptional regulator [Halobacillus sp. BBL2006]|uniref:TetR/AcrR family transcriptional regulator n=1 Tax=Halobacillus sp. BBL2006 TaxID=1543706 RepID=UPI000543BCEB|nr:TetR/AcrR family transcriptional regulator [Halobacillus sp. BBL2006]KHE72704.1 hypothetical protein LD39_03160 [Halobacillus sp. BBL2006]